MEPTITENFTFIYALCDPDTSIVRYIGKSDNPQKRYPRHLKDQKSTHKVNWINKLKSQNKKPVLKFIEKIKKPFWEETEKKWIAHYRHIYGNKLTNTTEGGEGINHTPEICLKISKARIGHKVSEKTRKKISKSKTNPSPEIRKKLSEAHKNLPINQGTLLNLKKMAKMRKGRPLKKSHKRNIAIANTGKIHSVETRSKLSTATTAYMNKSGIKEKQSQACLKQWKDPEFRKKRSEDTKKLWENPEYRDKRAKAQKEFNLKFIRKRKYNAEDKCYYTILPRN